MSPGWCLACPRGCGGPACELCKCENCQRGCYLSLWKSGPLLFQKQASDVGWGEGIPLQEVEVLGGGGLAGRGWEPPPQRPLQGASWSASYACLARPLDQLAREERWDCWGGGGGRAVGLCVPHGSFSRRGWGQFRVAAVG